MSTTHEKIDQIVKGHPVVLFMKGTAQFPMCGFSGRAIQILKACGVDRPHTVNVLEDDEIRQGIKDYANWPTIPQLYVNGEFIGGAADACIKWKKGELQPLLEAAGVGDGSWNGYEGDPFEFLPKWMTKNPLRTR